MWQEEFHAKNHHGLQYSDFKQKNVCVYPVSLTDQTFGRLNVKMND